MDEDLYRLLTANSGMGGVPQAVTAFEQMAAMRRGNEQAREQQLMERANAMMGQIEEQRQMESLLNPAGPDAGQRNLGMGARQARAALLGGDEMIPYEDKGVEMGMGDLEMGPPAALLSAFEQAGREPPESWEKPGVPTLDIKNPTRSGPARQAPLRLMSRPLPGHREAPVRYAESYSGPRSPEGMAAASKMRQETLKQRLGQERDVTKKEYSAREAELRAATAIATANIRATAQLSRRRAGGVPKGTDPFKWWKGLLDEGQRAADKAREDYTKQVNGALQDPAGIEQARAAREAAEGELESIRAGYEGAMAKAGAGRREKPVQPVKTETRTVNGKTYRKVPGGWEPV